jgi:hypothetical protein
MTEDGGKPRVHAEAAHTSLDVDLPDEEKIERNWRAYWLPLLLDASGKISLRKLKGELYDAFHLVNESRKVYRHVTGGVTDDLTASAEGIIAMADRQVERRLDELRGEIVGLRADLTEARRAR